MKYLIIIVLVCVANVFASTDNWDGLTIKYSPPTDLNPLAGKNIEWSFNVPKTIDEEIASGAWYEIESDNLYNLKALAFESMNDYGFNSLYDCNGILAGAQACQPYDVIKATGPPDYDPLTIENAAAEIKSIDGKEYICSSILFVSPETLMNGGRDSFTKTGDGIWLRNTANTETGYDKVTDDISELLNTTLFTKQNCIRFQGTHFLYNLTAEYDCTKFYTWFLIGDQTSGNIHGVGFNLFGDTTVTNKDYYDYVIRSGVEYLAPDANECLYDWTETYKLVTIHMFFTDFPENIACAASDIIPTN